MAGDLLSATGLQLPIRRIARKPGSTIGQPVYPPRSPLELHSFPSAAVECGKSGSDIKRLSAKLLIFIGVDVLLMEGLIT